MRYTLSILEDDFERLRQHLFAGHVVERAGYLLCRLSSTARETRLLVREFFPVADLHVKRATAGEMLIDRRSYVEAMQRADRDQSGLVFVHSHPLGPSGHSSRDDLELPKLFEACRVRIRHDVLHASFVFSDEDSFDARAWLPDGTFAPIDLVRVIGSRFRFFFRDLSEQQVSLTFDRQIRAFGEETQRILSRLHIGIVGYGGTGSSVAEQLLRLGIREVTVCDRDKVTNTNLTRIYGSEGDDEERPKIHIASRLAARIGFGAIVREIELPVTFESAAAELRDCDVIFCCTDDQWGRSILAKLASYYLVPVIDMGVKIPSVDGAIGNVTGRVSVMKPGSACVFCSGRVTPAGIAAEVDFVLDPIIADARRNEGYAPELGEPDPSVIFLTTAIAASAVTEFFARLTGFAGVDRPDEILHRFTTTRVSTVSRVAAADCFCGDRRFWAKGDVSPMLDLTWRAPQ